jgi:hypothetical protein
MRYSFPILLSFCLVPAVHAQTETELRTALRECAAITNINIRVACYDALADEQDVAPAAAASPPGVQAPEQVQVPQQVQSPAASIPRQAAPVADDFGLEAEVEPPAAEKESLVDTVSSVTRVEPTKVQVTLANGQVWRQMVGKTFVIRAGDTVRISSTGWGEAYRLAVEGRAAFIQVKRLQ